MAYLIQLLFVLAALLWVLSCFLPSWGWPPVLTVSAVVRCIIGLIVGFILYLIVLAILGLLPAVPR